MFGVQLGDFAASDKSLREYSGSGLMFSTGAINCTSSAQWFSATGPDSSAPKLFGIEGGMKLVVVVVVAYVLTVGIVPLLASTVGFVVGMLIAIIWRRIQSLRARNQGRC